MTDKDLDEKLREKAINNFGQDYKKANLDNIIFLAKEKKKKIIMYRLLAYSVCVCICFGVFLYFNNFNKVEEPIVENKANVEDNIDIDKVPTILYEIPNEYETTDSAPIYVAIIKIKGIQDLGIVDSLPKSNIKADVIEVLEGELNQLQIDFNVNEAIVSVDEVPKEIKEKISYGEKDKYIRLVVNDMMMKSTYPDIGKYYVVSLIIEKEGLKVLDDCGYPFYEFNIDDRKVKIDNEWLDFNVYN